MAYDDNKNPTGLSALTSLANDDTVIVGDTSDTTERVKIITKANLKTDLAATDAEIETAYNNQVDQVSSGEKTAGTETAIRRFSPKDVADMAGTHGGGGGGGSADAVTKDVTQATHGFSKGDVLKFASGVYAKSQADSAANAEAIGMISTVEDTDNFTITTHGYISGLSGLSANTFYFLSPDTAGAITATEPIAVGQVSKPIFFADTTTSGWLLNYRGL